MKPFLRTGLALVIGFLAGVLSIRFYTQLQEPSEPGGHAVPARPRHAAKSPLDPVDMQVLSEIDDAIARVARSVSPAVVNIFTSRTVTVRNPLAQDPFFRHFFGNRLRPQQRTTQSLGSGVVVSPEGHIASSYHVVEGADQIKAVLMDGRTLDAVVTGAESRTDMVILKVEGRDLAAVPFGDSDALDVGDFVMAIGNPYGFGHSVSRGIVSAVNRSAVGINPYEDFIQTDAAINPGNSGGALVNWKGELIGINSAIVSKTGGFHGIGLAIPSNLLKDALPCLMRGERISRGWLGTNVQAVNPTLAGQIEFSGEFGLVVVSVATGSPAELAGIEPADVLVRIDGREMRQGHHLRLAIGSKKAGDRVEVELWRKGSPRKLTVALGEMPAWDEARPASR